MLPRMNRLMSTLAVRIALTVMCGLPCFGPARVALAKKRAVILPFVGPHATQAKAGIVRAMRRRVELIPWSRYRRMGRRLRLNPRATASIPRICARIRCHAVVTGRVQRPSRRRLQLIITVHDGGSGKVLARRSDVVRSARHLERAAISVGRVSVRSVESGSLPPHGRGTRPSTPKTLAPTPAPPPSPPAPGAPPKPPSATPEIPALEEPQQPAQLETNSARPAQPKRPREQKARPAARRSLPVGGARGIFAISASVGMSARTVELTGRDPRDDRRYDGGLFPEFTVAGEVYPLALITRGFARHVGLALSYSRHISVSTDLPDDPNRPAACTFGAAVDTSSQEVLADLELRWPLPFDSAWQPVILATTGYGLRQFSLGPNDVLPSFTYQYVRLGLTGTVPLGTPLIALEIGGSLRPILTVGHEAVETFGSQTGWLGWSLHAGLRGQHGSGLFYFAIFEYLSFTLDFDGLDPSAQPRECSPDLAAPTSGTDAFLRAWAGVGYAL